MFWIRNTFSHLDGAGGSMLEPVEHRVEPVEHSVEPVEHSLEPVEHSVEPVEHLVKLKFSRILFIFPGICGIPVISTSSRYPLFIA